MLIVLFCAFIVLSTTLGDDMHKNPKLSDFFPTDDDQTTAKSDAPSPTEMTTPSEPDTTTTTARTTTTTSTTTTTEKPTTKSTTTSTEAPTTVAPTPAVKFPDNVGNWNVTKEENVNSTCIMFRGALQLVFVYEKDGANKVCFNVLIIVQPILNRVANDFF